MSLSGLDQQSGLLLRYAGGTHLPWIAQPPASVRRGVGESAVFEVVAGGGFPLSYQWQKDGVELADGGKVTGAQTARLMLAGVEAADAAEYRCRVANGYGSAFTGPANLTVEGGIQITSQPNDATISPGDSATLSVEAHGDGTLTYQWYSGPSGQTENPIPDATSAVFATPTLSTSASFWVRVSRGALNADSRTAIVSLLSIRTYAGLTITGPVGGQYRVEFAPRIGTPTDWQLLTHVTLTTSPYVFIDYDSPGAESRYYRAVLVP
jgi:hypothetical protein